jgi:arsenate reductase
MANIEKGILSDIFRDNTMNYNFLIVEPAAEQRQQLIRHLTAQFPDAEFSEAEDGRAALRSLGAKRVHAILSAWKMPGLDGEGLIQALRRNSVLARKPVLVYGADGQAKLSYQQDNCLAFVDLPLQEALLGKLLRSFLDVKSSEAPLEAAPAIEAASSSHKILFLCVNAAVRGPMAEGLAHSILGPEWIAASAGFKSNSVHPLAVRVMSEQGIDISSLPSRAVRDVDMNGIEMVVNLCFNEIAPMVAGRLKRYDWPVPDPMKGPGGEEDILSRMRMARDSMSKRMQRLAADFKQPALAR